MGRGRAKAKQTKVARELKYSSPQTDFERLQRELSGSGEDDAADQDGEDPWGIVGRLMAAVPSGSYLAVTHGAIDIDATSAEAARQFNERAAVPMTLRTQAEVARFFDGLDLLGPGVVPLDVWDLNQTRTAPGKLSAYGGLARKN